MLAMMSIHSSDTVYATIKAGGRTLATHTLTGFASMSELLTGLYRRLKGVAGLITVELRNGTAGLIERRTLMLRPSSPSLPVQLTLF